MARKVVGLKLGASRLNAACVNVNGSVEVVQLAGGPLPPGLIAGGEVREVEALGEALKEFFGKNKLPKRNVRIGLANNRIGVRTIEVSGIDDPKQLANAVRFRAQEALPIPIDEAVLDFQILGEGTAADGSPSRRVLLVVAYRDLIANYMEACRLAGIRLLGVDLEAFALLRALTPTFAEEPGGGPDRSALVAVSVGSERSVLGVSDGFSCEYTRVLDWGGNSLTDALARGLELEPGEAERIKVELGLQGDRVPDGVGPEQAVRAREALRAGLQAFGRELVSSLQFYQGQPDSLGIRELVLAGGTAQLAGLAAELQQLVGVPVRVGDPLAGVSVGKKLKGAEPSRPSPSPSASGWPSDGSEQGDQALGPLPAQAGPGRRGRGSGGEAGEGEEAAGELLVLAREEGAQGSQGAEGDLEGLPQVRARASGRPAHAGVRPHAEGERAREDGRVAGVPQGRARARRDPRPRGSAGAFMLMGARAKERQATADDLRAQLAELTAQAPAADEPSVATLTAEGQARTAALSDALAARVAWDRILREFSLVLPEGVWLTTLSSSSAVAPAPGAVVTDASGEGDLHHQRLRHEPGGRGAPALAPRGHPRVLQRAAPVELPRLRRVGGGRREPERQSPRTSASRSSRRSPPRGCRRSEAPGSGRRPRPPGRSSSSRWRATSS